MPKHDSSQEPWLGGGTNIGASADCFKYNILTFKLFYVDFKLSMVALT